MPESSTVIKNTLITVGSLIAGVVLFGGVAMGIFYYQFFRFERDVSISVPVAEDFERSSRGEVGEVVVSIENDGTIILNSKPISLEALEARLKAISKNYPDQAVILRGDSGTDFQKVVNVLDRLKAAGIWNVAFATKKTSD
ncbi:MAG: biopolymer transporter ExbD [Verrucomicrobiota bacterium]